MTAKEVGPLCGRLGFRENELRLRPFLPGDRSQLQRWLMDPDVRDWWGNAATAEAEFRIALESRTALQRMIELGTTEIGYAQAVEAGALGAGMPTGIGPGTWGCDLFIASAEHRGKGHGQAALDLLVHEVFSTTLAVACCIIVSIRNEQAARSYERIGFHWVSLIRDPAIGASWVMRRER